MSIVFASFNPFMWNGISHCYQLNQSISILRNVGWYFSLPSYFGRPFCKQTVNTLIRHCVLRRLVWACTVCLCPTKRTLGLYGLKHLPNSGKIPATIWQIGKFVNKLQFYEQALLTIPKILLNSPPFIDSLTCENV